MTKDIGLWIDHRRAVIVMLSQQGETIQQVVSEVGRHLPYRGATPPKTPYSAKYQQGDDQLDRRFNERLNRFYEQVIARIRDAGSLLILGPGEAKLELQKRLAHERVHVNVAAVETADKLTDRQIAARVRRYFKQAEDARGR